MPKAKTDTRHAVTIALFLAALWLPLADCVLKLDRTPLSTGRRDTVSFPSLDLTWQCMRQFPGRLKWYLQTNFGFRAALINWHGKLKYTWLGVPSCPSVLIGKDGWLYMSGEQLIDGCRCIAPFTDQQLEEWRVVLEERRAWLEERGIAYVFVVAPNKHTVYPEFLPDWITRVGSASRLDQLIEYLREKSRVCVVDVRPALMAAKKHGRVFHRTDTHWNELGGFIASEEVVKALRPRFPNLDPRSWRDLSVSVQQGPGGDTARALGLKYDIHEDTVRVVYSTTPSVTMVDGSKFSAEPLDVVYRERVETKCPDGQVRSGLFLRDSFGEAMLLPLAQHFVKMVSVWADSAQFDPKVIEEERPDVVIQEVVERRLMTVKPAPGALMGTKAHKSRGQVAVR